MTWLRGVFRGMRVRILAVVVLLLLVSSLASVLLLRAALFGQLDEEVAESLEREVAEFRLLSGGNDPRTGEPFDGELEAIFDVYFSREVPDEGEALLGFVDGKLYQSVRAQDAAPPEELKPASTFWLSLEQEERGEFNTGAGPARYVALPLRGRDGQEGTFVVTNFPAFERAEIQASLRTQELIALFSLAAASFLGALLAGRVLRPLRILAATARTLSDTDLSKRIPIRGQDEASLIAEAFNNMLSRLERVFATQRRFLDDTSHELRTPLTVIRGHVELLELDNTPAAREETTRLILDEVDRLTRMVDDLFLLAQADHPHFVRKERIGVPEFMTELGRKLSPLARLRLTVDVPAGLSINADAHRLTQAVMQLVANALKYAGRDPAIDLGAEVNGDDLVLSVTDDGPGIPPQQALEVFERGRRGAKGTTRGAGFGLAIVRTIAEAHGGTARLAPGTAVGARFELAIPLNTRHRSSRTAAIGR